HPTLSSFLPFFLTSPQPPPSTLFPYTTLFRSYLPTLSSSYSRAFNGTGQTLLPSGDALTASGSLRLSLSLPIFNQLQREQQVVQDRKSTRLNSSHVAISYAVFCLKKKKPISSS